MNEDDARLINKAKRLFELARPGLVKRFEQLDGEDLPVPKPPVVVPAPGGRSVQAVQASLARLAHARSGSIRVALRITAERAAPEWKIVQHSYHLGPSSSTDATYLRVCKNSHVPYHFHLENYEKAYNRGHIPADKADPPLSSEPIWFLELVENFIETRTIPIKVKP